MISVAYITRRNDDNANCQQDNPRLLDQAYFRPSQAVKTRCHLTGLTGVHRKKAGGTSSVPPVTK
jgi:hypothetical protein